MAESLKINIKYYNKIIDRYIETCTLNEEIFKCGAFIDNKKLYSMRVIFSSNIASLIFYFKLSIQIFRYFLSSSVNCSQVINESNRLSKEPLWILSMNSLVSNFAYSLFITVGL